MPKSLESVCRMVESLDARVGKLQKPVEILKSWSELNDLYLREMLDALDESLTVLYDKVGELHDIKESHTSISELPLEFPELKEIVINKGE